MSVQAPVMPLPASLPSHPLLKPWYRQSMEGDRLLFEYAHSMIVLHGAAVEKLLPSLLPLLNGEHNSQQIVNAFGAQVAPAVANALAMLHERNLLTEGPDLPATIPQPRIEAAQLLSTPEEVGNPNEVSEKIANAHVTVLGRGPLADSIAELLRTTGIGQVEPREFDRTELDQQSLVVVVADPNNLDAVATWNKMALVKSQSWLLVMATDTPQPGVGPLFVPGETSCFECFRHWLSTRIGRVDKGFWKVGEPQPLHPPAPMLDDLLAGMTAACATQWAAIGESALTGSAQPVSWQASPSLESELVRRVPRCPACSDAAGVGAPAPWYE